ncbi:D-aminoacyl-tRNA deacylase [Halostagnicola kamekurae]|uniref:D-aminoacyl-tRNA deacylase n=1 Tax=Halostagnicola kamekurae TaxID=619731 RepID=A0A1I6RVU6_9EURY|nr:D-aminoacyl-tRNA deacylase [Halostagnicola kamekurae]SFS68700.1 D-aminoacyl-tRNA deacylase [Halostagnicola kamekurae]
MIAIVESRADSASEHICQHLRECADWTELIDDDRPDEDGGGTYYRTDGFELRSFDELHIDLERPADAFDGDPDLLVFASRHAGDTGALLTGHFTGNFGPAEFGGDDHALAETAPNALARLLEAFETHAPAEYDVGMECTHHGPTDVGCPSLFAELGSDEPQWNDPDGARAVARAILELGDAEGSGTNRRGVTPHRERQVVGFGGNHYVPRYQRIVEGTPWAVGHIASAWALEDMGDPDHHQDVIEAAFDASGADLAVLEGTWPDLERVIEELGYEIVSETWLQEVGDRPLELVRAIESELGSVEEGVRFGDRQGALEDGCGNGSEDGDANGEAFSVVDLPTALLDTAESIDPERVRRCVEANTVAFTTENGGSRVGSTAAVPSQTVPPALIDSLAEVLEEKYDRVRLEDDAVVAEERAFDPDLAAEAGVPEGPKFGALANGSSVTVDGKDINPEEVRTDRTDRFPV